jgi:hypothetical protein
MQDVIRDKDVFNDEPRLLEYPVCTFTTVELCNCVDPIRQIFFAASLEDYLSGFEAISATSSQPSRRMTDIVP